MTVRANWVKKTAFVAAAADSQTVLPVSMSVAAVAAAADSHTVPPVSMSVAADSQTVPVSVAAVAAAADSHTVETVSMSVAAPKGVSASGPTQKLVAGNTVVVAADSTATAVVGG